jgi:hypothetical protein
MRKRAITTLLTVALATVAVSVTTALPASAMNSQQAHRWAAKWERQMKRTTQHARQHAMLLRTRLPQTLRVAARPTKAGSTSYSSVDWMSYGSTCKRTSERATRYVHRTWTRIAHPRRIVSAATWIPLLRHEGWPASTIPTVLTIIRRESGGSPTSWNRSTDCRGLFQIMARYYPGYRLFDPVVNIQVALRMYKARGWQPWSI